MPIPVAAYLSGAAISGLGGWLAGRGAEEQGKMSWRQYQAKAAEEQRRRTAARGYIGGYEYTPYGTQYQPYESPLAGAQRGTLAQYLTGELTPTQQAQIAQQRRLGEAGISRQAAGVGMPMGGRSALAVQLSRDLALGAGQMGAQQQQWAMQAAVPYEQMWGAEARRPYEYGLASWLRQQEAEKWKVGQMAQYA